VILKGYEIRSERIKGLSTKELRYTEKWVVGNMIVGVVGGLGLAIFIL